MSNLHSELDSVRAFVSQASPSLAINFFAWLIYKLIFQFVELCYSGGLQMGNLISELDLNKKNKEFIVSGW
jgi:hypothetical protein